MKAFTSLYAGVEAIRDFERTKDFTEWYLSALPKIAFARQVEVGVAALGWRCFGASDHGPVSFRRVGQSVDLPAKARRWGHGLRGSRQSGSVKPWS